VTPQFFFAERVAEENSGLAPRLEWKVRESKKPRAVTREKKWHFLHLSKRIPLCQERSKVREPVPDENSLAFHDLKLSVPVAPT